MTKISPNPSFKKRRKNNDWIPAGVESGVCQAGMTREESDRHDALAASHDDSFDYLTAD
jgi:hypothetical protein